MRFMLPYFVISTLLFHHVMSQARNCANPADIMFLLDGSDSIDAQEWDQERNFLARMISALDVSPSTINIGFTVYSADIDSHYSLTPFRPKVVLMAYARSLQQARGIATNTARGIEKVRETFRLQPASRRNVPKILIVITDGSSENPAETIRQARLAKEEGIRIMSVAVGNNVFVEELEQIASNTRKFYRAADFAALKGIEKDIQSMICRVITTTQSPRITFAPPTQPPNLVPLDGDRICNNPGDIIFVIDGSDSISDQDFVRLKGFVANMIENFEIGPDAIHVGMIVYSTLLGDKIGLSPPKNKMVLKFLTNKLGHPKFGTDTALGIQAAREMMSQQGRTKAPEIIVVITDGRSSNPRNTIVQANIAKAQGMTMIAIGVGKAIFSEELTQIASGPNYVSEVTDFTALENTVNMMRNLICTSMTTTSTTMLPPTAPPAVLPPSDDLNCKVPGDVVFLLDGSDSIERNDWIRQRNFVANMISNLEVGQPYIHVSVIVYSSSIGEEIPFVPFNPKPSLKFKVQRLPQPRFGTDTALGIQRARDLLRTQGRQNAPRIIIVVTDGKSTYPENTALQANMAKADGAIMISIGIGADIFESELSMIASSPAKVYKVLDFAALQNITRSLRDTICRVVQTTTVAPATTTVPTTTTTEMATPMPVSLIPCIDSRTAADIVFLMDGSMTSDPYNWMMETHFVSNFLDGLEVNQQFVHVGVVISDSVRGDTVGISPFKSRNHLKELIHGMLHPSGEMDTAAGMAKVKDIFRYQGRPGAQKIMISVTDSSSKSATHTIQQATHLKQDGVEIVTVGVGGGINPRELQAIASSPRHTLVAGNFNTFFNILPALQMTVCEILRRAQTTTAAPVTTPAPPSLCDGCLVETGVGFNPFPGDCTKYVQCWKEGDQVRSLVRSCPFGQFWDADAITCRPSFLVNCTADPCKVATTGFTYGMVEYGCRAYWKCLDGFSVGYCCPVGSSYVEGMGCLQGTGCNEECPPKGGLAVKPVCDKRPHWDKRYYIQIVYGRGEVVRPCPVGTIFFEEKCSCDFGMSGLLPATPNVKCQPLAFFPFDRDLFDKSFHDVNTGRTNLIRTDLGTAYFNGRSEMNLWRFAGADWGNKLVIKFKFRFDHSNKFIDYGGLPVDLGVDFDVNMNLINDYQMTDMDWRLWNQLSNVKSLQDWRRLLQEFGQSRTFYVFLGQLGFKPGTSNSQQVISILGTPEAYSEFRVLLGKLQPHMHGSVNLNDKTTSGLKGILSKLSSMRTLINWKSIVAKLKGEGQTGGQGTGQGQEQISGGGTSGTAQYKWDSTTGQWVKVSETATGTNVPGASGAWTGGNMLNIGGTEAASTWRWNSVSGQWERLAAVPGGAAPSGGSDVTFTQTKWTTGPSGNWSTQGSVAGSGGFNNWQWRNDGAAASSTGTGSAAVGQGGSMTGGMQGAASWEDILRELNKMENSTSTSSWTWKTAASATQGGNVDANRAAIEALLKQLKLTGGQAGSATWEWSKTGNTVTGQELDMAKLNGMLRQLQQSADTRAAGTGAAGEMYVTSGGSSATGFTGNTVTGHEQDMAKLKAMLRQLQQSADTRAAGSGAAGGATFDTSQTIVTSGGNSGAGLTGHTVTGHEQDMAKLNAMLRQLQQSADTRAAGSGAAGGATFDTSQTIVTSGGNSGAGLTGNTVTGHEQDMIKLNAMLRQLRQSADTQAAGSGGAAGGATFDTSEIFVTSGGNSATGFTGGMGSNTGSGGSAGGSSKTTVQVKKETEVPNPTGVNIAGGVVVGGSFGGGASRSGQASSGSAQSSASSQTGTSFVEETSSRREGNRRDAGNWGRRETGGWDGTVVRQTVTGKSEPGIPDRSALRGADAIGVQARNVDGQIIGLHIPNQGDFVSGATVIGKDEHAVRVTHTEPQIRVTDIVQQIEPMTWGASSVEGFGGGGASGGQASWSSSGGASSGLMGGASGGSHMTSGSFTQMGSVAGEGGGVRRVVDTNMKKIPAGSVQFNADGGVNLASLGLGGAEGANIIRQTIRIGPDGQPLDGSGAAGSGQFFGTMDGSSGADQGMFGQSSGQFNLGGGGQFSQGGSEQFGLGGSDQFSQGGGGQFSQGGGGQFSQGGSGQFGQGGSGQFDQTGSNQFMDMNTLQGTRLANTVGQGNTMLWPFFTQDNVENVFDTMSGKRRRRRSAGRSRAGRSKRAVDKQAYQALVTNCQGQNGKGPSIMVVANQNDVQFALKTYSAQEPGIISVPAVEGWNDVTLIYDGITLTGIVENWKGFHKSSVNLSGNIERRQAGLLVGSCQGFASFHGEIDDLSVYNCLTPAVTEMRDRIVV